MTANEAHVRAVAEEAVVAAFELAYDQAIDLHADDGPYCDLPAVRAGLTAARPLIAAEVRAEVAAAISALPVPPKSDSATAYMNGLIDGYATGTVDAARIATEEAP